MIEIVDKLFLGNKEDAQDRGKLRANRFVALLNCAKNLDIKHDGFSYLKLDLTEWSEISKPMIEEVRTFIETWRKRGNVLVHCVAGMQRSPSVIVAYLILQKEMTMSEAVALVEEKTTGHYYPSIEMLRSIQKAIPGKKTDGFPIEEYIRAKEGTWTRLLQEAGIGVLERYKNKESQILH